MRWNDSATDRANTATCAESRTERAVIFGSSGVWRCIRWDSKLIPQVRTSVCVCKILNEEEVAAVICRSLGDVDCV